MKNIFLLILFACVSFVASAQTVTLTAWKPETTYQLISTDYVLTNTTARTFVLSAPQHQPTTQDFVIHLDSTSGNHTNVAVALYGNKSDIGTYAQIGSTVNWKGTTADTTIIISNTSANRYRLYKWVITGTGTGTSTIATQEFKLYRE